MENGLSNEQKNEFTYKIILLGDTQVGKTSLIERYIHNVFSEKVQQTVTFQSFYTSSPITYENKKITLNIWDTAGQEQFDSLTKITFRDAKAVLLVFALDNLATLETLDKWEYHVSEILGDDAVFFCVVGTKCDLVNDEIAQQAMQRAQSKFPDIKLFRMTSSKKGFGVNDLFTKVAEHLTSEYPSQNQALEPIEQGSKCC